MKKVLKTVIAVCLLAVCLLAMPLMARAAQKATVASGTCGDNLTWEFFDDGSLEISGSGKMMDESFLTAAPWDRHIPNIKTVTVGTGITDIATNAFADCTKLESVVIPDTVTRIGESAFSGCINLKSVRIPNSVTTIGWYAFYGCSSLESATLSNKITEIPGWLFYGCKGLRFIVVPTGVLTVGEYAFADCETLNTVAMPDTLKSVKAYAFSNCSALTTLSLPQSVTELGDGAFSGCAGLENITIPANARTLGVSLFQGCSSLERMTLPNGITAVPTQTFLDCTALKTVSIPGSVTDIGNNAFWGCTSLESITIPAGVTKIGSAAFYKCAALKTVAIPQGVSVISGHLFGECTALESVTLPSTVTAMGDYVFYKCESLKKATIPNGITAIGKYTFFECTALSQVTIPAAVTSIGDYAFYKCAALPSVDLPAGLTAIGTSAFSHCDLLESAAIPAGVTEIGRYAFLGCDSLKEIRVADSNTNYSSDAFGVLYDQAKTRLLQAPGAISGSYVVPESVTIIGGYAFMYCDSLEEITLGKKITDVGANAFSYCSGLDTMRFLGDAPTFSGDVLHGVTATAYYPADNATWTAGVRQNYGGTITWLVEGEAPQMQWVQATLSLEGNIGINFYVTLNETLVNDEGTVMRFTINGETIDVPLAAAILRDGKYIFTCPVSAKNMADDVTAQIFCSQGAVGDSRTLSVRYYAMYMINNSQNPAIVKLMKAMLNYGAAAQMSFNHNTGDLANKDLSAEDKILANVDASAYAHSVIGSEAGIRASGITLVLETETAVRVLFTLDGTKTIDQYTFKVDGEVVQPQLRGGNVYFIEIPNIAAQDLDDIYNVTVGGLTVRYGGLSYVNQINNLATATQLQKDMAKALFAYWNAAENYFNSL